MIKADENQREGLYPMGEIEPGRRGGGVTQRQFLHAIKIFSVRSVVKS